MASARAWPKRPAEGRFRPDHGPVADKCPRPGSRREIVGRPTRDRVVEKAHDGRGLEFIRGIPAYMAYPKLESRA